MAETESQELTKEQAAKLVAGEIPVTDDQGEPLRDKNGNVRTKRAPLSAKEVFAVADHGDYVVVVTTDGRKLRGAKK